MPIISILYNFDIELEIIFSWNSENIENRQLDFFQKTNENLLELATWEKIFVSPWVEIFCTKKNIFPLFENILKDFLLSSRVGKIWLFSQLVHRDWQKYIQQLFDNFEPSECQKLRRGWNGYRLKYLQGDVFNAVASLWNRNFMLSKLIWLEIKKAKNEALDSILPLDYKFLDYSNLVNKKLWAKMNFFDFKQCQKIVENLLKECWIEKGQAKLSFVFESGEEIYRSNKKYRYLFREN